jgi:hypothetical protein
MPTGSPPGGGTKTLEDLLNADYVDESCVFDVVDWTMAGLNDGTALRHMEAYARFLSMNDGEINEMSSPVVQPDTPLPETRRVRRVSALSDFAPVNLKVRK